MTREKLKEHCQRQIQNFERVEKIMPVTPNDWKRYEEHKLILELLEQEPTLDKIRAEIENHCGLAKENHCKYCSYCTNLMGVREILETIDKYKAESEDKE